MNCLIITLDLDWACEASIEEALVFFKDRNIPPTLFSTHCSEVVETNISLLDVGLHPYFHPQSSHGSTIDEVVHHVMDLPHNLAAFRCHRFASCNSSRQAMQEAGMKISSNVCTDLQQVTPFRDRFGLLEVPIFLEDGGYLYRKHPMEIHPRLEESLMTKDPKVLLIHPMHLSLNTPEFGYMQKIKQSMNRTDWNTLTKKDLRKLRWKGRGIRDLLVDLLQLPHQATTLKELL